MSAKNNMTPFRELTTAEQVVAALRAGEAVEFEWRADGKWFPLSEDARDYIPTGFENCFRDGYRYRARPAGEGDSCPHEAWEENGGARKCADCGEYLGSCFAPAPTARTYTKAEAAEAMRGLVPAAELIGRNPALSSLGFNACRAEILQRIDAWSKDHE